MVPQVLGPMPCPVPLLDSALQGLGTGITNGQAEKSTQDEHNEKIPDYVVNIGRFEGRQVKATLEHFLESIRQKEEDFDKNEAKEEV